MPSRVDKPQVPLTAQIGELKRELEARRSAYPVRVRAGLLTPALAARQIAVMQAALATLLRLAAERRPAP